jgi:Leucine-rich repeat (LRR) protein
LKRLGHLRYGSLVTGLSDACLIPIQGLTRLEELSLAGNRITDDGIALIAGLHELESLDLTATDVTDAGLIHLHALKKLKSLSLGGTLATAQGARELQSALPDLEVSFDCDPALERGLKQSRREH